MNPSGGVLSSNPIGASGLIRFAEAAIQVMGKARRPPGAGCAKGVGARLRRWLAVLLDVGGRRDKPARHQKIEQAEQTQAKHPAHEAGRRSREAVRPGTRKPGWRCSPTTPSSKIPIGPSAFDPEGKGHRGRDAISAFWDKAIAPTDKIEFVFRDTYQCGNEEANVGHILITTGDYQITAEGVFTYKANDEGKMVALRAYWEMERAAANTRKV